MVRRHFDALKAVRCDFDEMVRGVAEAREQLLQGFTVWSNEVGLGFTHGAARKQHPRLSQDGVMEESSFPSLGVGGVDPGTQAYLTAVKQGRQKAMQRRTAGRRPQYR